MLFRQRLQDIVNEKLGGNPEQFLAFSRWKMCLQSFNHCVYRHGRDRHIPASSRVRSKFAGESF
jgi:hypothetical protein